MNKQHVETTDSKALERRIKFIELAIITITAFLALIAIDQPKQIILSVLLLLLGIVSTLLSFIFDSFIEKKEIIKEEDSTIIKSKIFNYWDWLYFLLYSLAILYFSYIILKQYIL